MGAYGIKGWVRVRSHSPESNTLLDVTDWWLKPAGGVSESDTTRFAHPVKVVSSRVHGDAIVARFTDIPDRTQAEKLKGWTIWVSRDDFALLESEEYYWVDLVGCRLYSDESGQPALIGKVTGVIDNGAHGILQVACSFEGADGHLKSLIDSKGRPREILVPFVAAHVHTVDLESKRLISNWPVD